MLLGGKKEKREKRKEKREKRKNNTDLVYFFLPEMKYI